LGLNNKNTMPATTTTAFKRPIAADYEVCFATEAKGPNFFFSSVHTRLRSSTSNAASSHLSSSSSTTAINSSCARLSRYKTID